ncbi:hypothetical protein BA899_08835 [Spiribacter sp. SSL99]|uniref:class I SAM-dependent methyltransferase n=1 Tax=Spiribacter sp. SSL99 TaxID=1866884 RepID=UPI0013310619|nr:class I SAM-dependent methyltransferase [Spiribacter sp. SSL99]KAF0286448.1 hypothetical protein BA899_08835 [Spiribacter sp. SSL99]
MPEQFAARWLTLREPADHAARDDTLLTPLIDVLPRDRTIRITDLGAGAGSNLRYLGPRLPQAQAWTLIDHDRGLLDQAVALAHPADDDRHVARVQARAHPADLGTFPDCLDTTPDLLTASALLDLVPDAWLRRVVDTCCRRGLPALFALNVDGRLAFSPTLEADQQVEAAVLAHQRGAKDMGPALGPDAPAVAAQLFRERGASVDCRASDWHLTPEQAALQRPLIEGWHAAARAQQPDAAAVIDRWRDERLRALEHSFITVGHQDLLVIPCRD